MDMREVSNFTDFFVIVSGDSAPQLKAITSEIGDTLLSEKMKPFHREGDEKGGWVLIDCGDVVVHIFHHNLRGHYLLEELWGDAPCEHYHED
jgi:ribosome-associated protein